MRLLTTGFCLLLLILGVLPAEAAGNPSSTREGLLAAVNAERAKMGAAPMQLSAALPAVAQARAEELGRKGDLNAGQGSEDRLEQDLKRAGYRAQRWIESEISSGSSLPEVGDYWRRHSGDTHRQAMGRDFREAGVGGG